MIQCSHFYLYNYNSSNENKKMNWLEIYCHEFSTTLFLQKNTYFSANFCCQLSRVKSYILSTIILVRVPKANIKTYNVNFDYDTKYTLHQ